MQEANIVDITPFLAKHQLPLKYQYLSEQYFIPLAEDIISAKPTSQAMLVGINGCQGSGKTTLADFLVTWINSNTDFNSISISIDDFYYSRSHRAQLANGVHPLFATRGVPGTHNVALMSDTIVNLLAGKTNIALPEFDKQSDEPVVEDKWKKNNTAVDIVIFEGWCVASTAQQPYQLESPINQLEDNEDKDGVWRRCINSCLANEYKNVFNLIDYQIMLKAPSFKDVYGWRLEQEQKLLADRGVGHGTFDESSLVRFISHFERITRENLKVMPEHVDALLTLDKARDITSMVLKADTIPAPLIFTDLDGTLLNHDDYDCAMIQPFLAKLTAVGISVVFNTSKTFAEVTDLQSSLNHHQPFITENGSAVYIPKKYFAIKPIGCEEIDGYWRYPLAPSCKSLHADLKQHASDLAHCYQLFSELTPSKVASLTGLGIEQSKLALAREYSDPIYWQGTDQQLQVFLARMETLGYEVLVGGRFIHVNKQTNKGKAQNWLLNQFKHHYRHPFTTIALGDSQNDMAMLDEADIAVLITNPQSKAKAKLSTKPWRISDKPAPQGWIDEVTDINIIKAHIAPKQEQSHG